MLYRRMLADKRVPPPARLLLWVAVGYALLPFDLIPDFIPVVGHFDDILVITALAALAFRLLPGEVMEEYRAAMDDG